MAYRLDAASPISKRTTVQGGLILPAAITRTGVFTYYKPDGTVASRELRSPDEVFKGDSLASLAYAPVTVRHPSARKVDPSNWREVTVGTVDGEGRQDGIHVAADVRVQDAGTIKAIEGKHLVEISAGYHCKTDATPGTYDGPNGPEAYTHVQRDIRYNHIALLPANEGRAGSSVRLRLDSAGDAVEDPNLVNDGTLMAYPMLTPEQVTALQADRDALKVKCDAYDKLNVDAMIGQVAFLKGEVTRLTTELTAAKTAQPDQTKTDALVDARVALVTEARLVLDEKDKPFMAHGKSDHDVRVAVLAKIAPSFKCDGMAPGAVEGAYALAVASKREGAAGLAAVQGSTPAAVAGTRTDEKDSISDARAKAAQASADAWKTPRAIRAIQN